MFFGGIFSRDIQGRNFFPDTFLRVGKGGIFFEWSYRRAIYEQ